MGEIVVRIVLLLAVISAILGVSQCAHKSQSLGSPIQSFRDAGRLGRTVIRKLTISSAFRDSRGIPSSADNDGSSSSDGGYTSNDDGSGSGIDEPASGTNPGGSGSGVPGSSRPTGSPRHPRSPRRHRSRSPSSQRGGGDGASSSSGPLAFNRRDGRLHRSKINPFCQHINELGDNHVINDMQLAVFVGIIRQLKETVTNDECRTSSDGTRCQDMFSEFKKIPPEYRGECSNAISSQCYHWVRERSWIQETVCTFFVPANNRAPRTRINGYYITLADCIKGLQNQLFMDGQLASVGINMPDSPGPLLLPGDSPPSHYPRQ